MAVAVLTPPEENSLFPNPGSSSTTAPLLNGIRPEAPPPPSRATALSGGALTGRATAIVAHRENDDFLTLCTIALFCCSCIFIGSIITALIACKIESNTTCVALSYFSLALLCISLALYIGKKIAACFLKNQAVSS